MWGPGGHDGGGASRILPMYVLGDCEGGGVFTGGGGGGGGAGGGGDGGCQVTLLLWGLEGTAGGGGGYYGLDGDGGRWDVGDD